tara:strand:- start:344 stop:586 length:243 start_codon:yes stop_codon:yes gene_type:complete
MSKKYTLYQFPECPFCQLVLKELDKLKLEIPTKNTRLDPEAREELISLTGRTQVPCLVIDGKPLLESNDIVNYLRQEYAQ